MNSGSTSNLSHHLKNHKNKIDVNVNKQAMMLDRFLKSGSNIRDVLLEILELNKSKENESGKKLMGSLFLNGIIDMTIVKE
ncbi:3204_t:CDS:2 [Entrophospora sp. SA101]|nr:3204_t:CDS:2 [Entrophospora sp. SA101]